jgi:hypothetical protein
MVEAVDETAPANPALRAPPAIRDVIPAPVMLPAHFICHEFRVKPWDRGGRALCVLAERMGQDVREGELSLAIYGERCIDVRHIMRRLRVKAQRRGLPYAFIRIARRRWCLREAASLHVSRAKIVHLISCRAGQ